MFGLLVALCSMNINQPCGHRSAGPDACREHATARGTRMSCCTIISVTPRVKTSTHYHQFEPDPWNTDTSCLTEILYKKKPCTLGIRNCLTLPDYFNNTWTTSNVVIRSHLKFPIGCSTNDILCRHACLYKATSLDRRVSLYTCWWQEEDVLLRRLSARHDLMNESCERSVRGYDM